MNKILRKQSSLFFPVHILLLNTLNDNDLKIFVENISSGRKIFFDKY